MRFVLAFLQGFAAIAGACVGIATAGVVLTRSPWDAAIRTQHELTLTHDLVLPALAVVMFAGATVGAVAFTIGWRRLVMERFGA